VLGFSVDIGQAADFGVKVPAGEVTVDFPFVMERMRKLRAGELLLLLLLLLLLPLLYW
jgi:hypothetical protein